MILYRMFDADGALLYVGISREFRTRLASHRRSKAWWPKVAEIVVEGFADWMSAAEAEQSAIETERPRFNRRERPYFPALLPPRVRGEYLTRQEMAQEFAEAERAIRDSPAPAGRPEISGPTSPDRRAS